MHISFRIASKVTIGRCLEDDQVAISFQTGGDEVEVWVDDMEAAELAHALLEWAKKSRENDALALCEYTMPPRSDALMQWKCRTRDELQARGCDSDSKPNANGDIPF
jgi:hypothetical protein